MKCNKAEVQRAQKKMRGVSGERARDRQNGNQEPIIQLFLKGLPWPGCCKIERSPCAPTAYALVEGN